MLKLTLPNGLSLEGPHEVVMSTVVASGFNPTDLFPETEWYVSASKGPVRIKEMQLEHLKNVVRKRIDAYVKHLHNTTKTGNEFVEALAVWKDLDSQPGLSAMLANLNGRS